jgi:antitoxin VapB
MTVRGADLLPELFATLWKKDRSFLPVSLNIKDSRTHELVRRLAAATGETQTEAVRVAVQERLRRVEAGRGDSHQLVQRLNEIARHCAFLPVRRMRTEDDILGYNERGLPD